MVSLVTPPGTPGLEGMLRVARPHPPLARDRTAWAWVQPAEGDTQPPPRRRTKAGSAGPTERMARTGELTPRGMSAVAFRHRLDAVGATATAPALSSSRRRRRRRRHAGSPSATRAQPRARRDDRQPRPP